MRTFFAVVGMLLCLTPALFAQPSPPPDPNKIQVLIITGQHVHDWRGTTPIPGAGIHQPMLWTTQYGMGRVFATTLGHIRVRSSNPSERRLPVALSGRRRVKSFFQSRPSWQRTSQGLRR